MSKNCIHTKHHICPNINHNKEIPTRTTQHIYSACNRRRTTKPHTYLPITHSLHSTPLPSPTRPTTNNPPPIL